jgi:hypothetical protein
MRFRIFAPLILVGILMGYRAVAADLSITVGTQDLPLSASTSVEIYLHPGTNAVSSVGATLTYTPADLAVDFAGINQQILGGVTAAVHRIDHRPGKVTAAAARPAGTGHSPTSSDWFMLLEVRRLATNTATLTIDDAFTAIGPGPTFNDVALSNIVFGIISDDSDGDGINDAWEFAFFQGLDTAGPGTDFDGDGVTDLQEFLDGTNPRIPYLTLDPELTGVAPTGPTRLSLAFPTETNVRYRVEYSTTLRDPLWLTAMFAVESGGPANQTILIGDGSAGVVYVDYPSSLAAYYRLVVDPQ